MNKRIIMGLFLTITSILVVCYFVFIKVPNGYVRSDGAEVYEMDKEETIGFNMQENETYKIIDKIEKMGEIYYDIEDYTSILDIYDGRGTAFLLSNGEFYFAPKVPQGNDDDYFQKKMLDNVKEFYVIPSEADEESILLVTDNNELFGLGANEFQEMIWGLEEYLYEPQILSESIEEIQETDDQITVRLNDGSEFTWGEDSFIDETLDTTSESYDDFNDSDRILGIWSGIITSPRNSNDWMGIQINFEYYDGDVIRGTFIEVDNQSSNPNFFEGIEQTMRANYDEENDRYLLDIDGENVLYAFSLDGTLEYKYGRVNLSKEYIETEYTDDSQDESDAFWEGVNEYLEWQSELDFE